MLLIAYGLRLIHPSLMWIGLGVACFAMSYTLTDVAGPTHVQLDADDAGSPIHHDRR